MGKWSGRWIIMFFTFLLTLATVHAEEASAINPVKFFIIILVTTTVLGIIAVLGGVGGGVVFTPVMMGFTSMDSFIIRATGLLVAMAGSLVAARPFLRKGLANIRLIVFAAFPYSVFAVIGALLAGYIKETMGITGDALIRIGLGVLVIIISIILITAGKKIEYPEIKEPCSFTDRLELAMAYWEESLGKVVDYKLVRAHYTIPLFCAVGLISGLFGLGAGWAMVPVFNLVMMAPLKVAACCSKVLIGIGDTAAVWPYLMAGGLFPLFAVPSMLGLMIGTMIGAKIMIRIKAGFVRWLIIAIMIFSGIRLLMKGWQMLHMG